MSDESDNKHASL